MESNTNNAASNRLSKSSQRVPLNDRTNVLSTTQTTDKQSLNEVLQSLQTLSVSDPLEKTEIRWRDIDAGDNDPQSLSTFVNDIYDFLYENEKIYLLPEAFLQHQTDISEKMRTILVDWLVEVHRMFKLLNETLFLAIWIVDKFLECKKIKKDQLQLVGITAMLIASKYEEIYPPECSDFVYVSDGAYTKKQILDMERLMLNTLDFKLTAPLSLHFLRRYSKAAESDYACHNLCKYLLESSLLIRAVHSMSPSLLAATSVYVARVMLNVKDPWNDTLRHYTKYSERAVKTFAPVLNGWVKTVKGMHSTVKAVETKYGLQKFGGVAAIPLKDF